MRTHGTCDSSSHMCSINGWQITRPGELAPKYLDRMRETMLHRGPDDHGSFVDEQHGIALAHNRLSIIDLTQQGHQPMINPVTGDVLVFNGEIYNFRELRKQLEAEGYRFRSESDTEVLLLAFQLWGIDCVNRVRGMFAFAIWSPLQNSLYLTRDPMGIKPLYYWTKGEEKEIFFASEIKAFLTLPSFARSINPSSLGQFLEFGYSCGQDTIFENVRKVSPGTWMRIVGGCVVENTVYFNPGVPTGDKHLDTTGLLEKTFHTLDQVVSEHLVADVPVGILLSGGLDSSLIAALAAKHAPIQTFTMGFADSQVDEREFARIVSDFIGSNHYELKIRPEEIIEDLEQNVNFFDDLFADWGMISTRLLYQKCQLQGIKVVIVGEGADELFGGYAVFKKSLEGRLKGPRHWRLFQLYRLYAGKRYGGCFFEFSRLMKCYLDESNDDYFHAIRMFESRNQLPNNYVMKVDKASMAVSVEARAPYLDSRVAEMAFCLPRDALISADNDKYILRQVAAKYQLLPDEIINRKKFGASVAASWMDDSPSFRSYARDVILDPAGWVDQLGYRKAMLEYFDRRRTGYNFPHSLSLFRNLAWRLLLLNLWSRSYLKPMPDA